MFRRVLAAVIVVAAAAILLALAWPQFFGLQRAYPMAQVIAFRGAVTAIGVVLVLLLGVIALASRVVRRFVGSLALLLLVFVLLNAAVLSTRGFGDAADASPADGDVTVLSWNTLGDVPGSATIAALALAEGADVVSLPETTEALGLEVAAAMKAGGRPMWLHTQAFDQVSKARSTTVLTSVDLGDYDEDRTGGSTAVLPSVVLRPSDGDGPVIVAVHAVAPLPVEMGNWRADLDWLAGICSSEDTIMAGDFNSTLDHMSGLGTGAGTALGACVDAAAATGEGSVGTWPTSAPALLGSPIDHVMAGGDWTAVDSRVVETLDDAGSDHRPVVATLRRDG
jgi:endonuclease/exonuclease/phosphatase (EEP) superfamily protein YafD